MKALARYLTEKYIYIFSDNDLIFLYTKKNLHIKWRLSTFINTTSNHVGQLGRLDCMGCDGV